MEGRADRAPLMKSLLLQSQRLSSALPSDLPPLALGLDQIEAQSRRLLSRTQPQKQNDTKAAFLLAGGGVNADELMRDVAAVNLVTTFEPLKPIHDTDIEGYLQHEHEQHVISAIEEGRRQTTQDFYKQMNNFVHGSWEKQRLQLFEDLLAHNPTFALQIGEGLSTRLNKERYTSRPSSNEHKSLGSLQMHPQMLRYFLTLQRLHEHRKLNRPYALASAFQDASKPSGSDFRSVAVQQLWQILASQIGEREVVNGEFQREIVSEKQYLPSYIKEVTSPLSAQLRQQIAQGSVSFLETQFLHHMDREIAARPVEANLGGIPTIGNKVRAYLNIKFQKQTMGGLEVINNVPVWARIFYLLRSGHPREAVEYASNPANQLQIYERSFTMYLKAWLDAPDRRLPKALRDRFLSEYNSRVRSLPSSELDPFKQALYKLIGRVELNRRSLPRVLETTEDWLWFQLNLVRDMGSSQDPQHEKYTLQDLANVVQKFGESYFDPKGNRPMAYAQVLLICGQFETFVDVLNKAVGYQIEAVHFAITLGYYGLLRSTTKSNISDGDILHNEGTTPYLNYPRLIYRYIRPMSKANPSEAVQYLYTICFHSDYAPDHTTLCQHYIRELAVETPNLSSLLGEILPSGDKREGQLQHDIQLLPIADGNQFIKDIIKAAAEHAEEEKRLNDAIQLYHLGENYNAMISVLNVELGNSIAKPLMTNGTSVEDSTLTLAINIMAYVQRSASVLASVERSNKETLETLVRLREALHHFEREEYQDAITILRNLGLIPLDGDLMSIMRKADEFKELDPSIARNFDNVLLATMTILCRLHENLKDSPYGEQARQSQLAQLRSQGKALVMFASMLRYRMLSNDTFSDLTRLEVSMR